MTSWLSLLNDVQFRECRLPRRRSRDIPHKLDVFGRLEVSQPCIAPLLHIVRG